jgi:hypothetical protein
MGIEREIRILLQQLPNINKKIILGYPITCILGKKYWETAENALRETNQQEKGPPTHPPHPQEKHFLLPLKMLLALWL